MAHRQARNPTDHCRFLVKESNDVGVVSTYIDSFNVIAQIHCSNKHMQHICSNHKDSLKLGILLTRSRSLCSKSPCRARAPAPCWFRIEATSAQRSFVSQNTMHVSLSALVSSCTALLLTFVRSSPPSPTSCAASKGMLWWRAPLFSARTLRST